jgi:hypothetical protein
VIYRIIGESHALYWDEDGNLKQGTGKLQGAMFACLGDFGDLPAPRVTNPRVRFWFTEAGWREYGRHIIADARLSGRTYRLLRRKNPPRSAVVYRDRWQVALLPPRRRCLQ